MAVTRTSTDWKTGAAVKTTETLFSGATLRLDRVSTRVMSDVWESLPYATVWNGATGEVEVVWHDGAAGTVDAAPEVVEAANRWLLAAATAKRKREWDDRVAKGVADAKRVAKGKTVTVVKGRKVAKGTTGTVIWVGEGKNFGPVPRYRGGWSTAAPLRLGVKDADGTVHWTAASNVEVVNPDEHFDFDLWVTNEPDHGADALADLNGGHGAVKLGAGEDGIWLSGWFKTAVAVAAAA